MFHSKIPFAEKVKEFPSWDWDLNRLFILLLMFHSKIPFAEISKPKTSESDAIRYKTYRIIGSKCSLGIFTMNKQSS